MGKSRRLLPRPLKRLVSVSLMRLASKTMVSLNLRCTYLTLLKWWRRGLNCLDSPSSSASKRMPRRTCLMMSTTSDFLSAVSAGSRAYPHSGMSGAKEGGCGDVFQSMGCGQVQRLACAAELRGALALWRSSFIFAFLHAEEGDLSICRRW